MKIDKITFQTTYNIGPFLNVKVGFEAELSAPYMETDGSYHIESPEEVLSNLRKLADDWHKKEYPHLYQDKGLDQRLKEQIMEDTYLHPPKQPTVIDYKKKEELEMLIDGAQTVADLAVFKEEAGKNGLVSQYMKKLKELTNG